jgi:paraquat-inducible protein B
MSKRVNPTTLGVFIALGLALGVAGLLLFSSNRLFSDRTKFIIYFDSSLNGLQEGAPVKYRGVTIGSVYRLMIHFNQAPGDTAMPVIIEINEDLVRQRLAGATMFTSLADIREELTHGLRATLETESLVTGVLYVSLEVQRDAQPPVYHEQGNTYTEIPSRATDIQQLMKNLARLDIAGLEDKISSLVTRIDSILSSLRLGEITENATNTLALLSRVISSPDLTNSFTSLKGALDEYHLLAEKLNARVDPLAEGATNTLAQASAALSEIRYGVRNLRDMLAPDAALRHDLELTLEQLTTAGQSLSELADYYRNHPNAVITGRRSQEKNP